jgi:actin-related protein
MYHSGQDIGAVVGDLGSTTTKIGLAGEDFPRLACYSCDAVSTARLRIC